MLSVCVLSVLSVLSVCVCVCMCLVCGSEPNHKVNRGVLLDVAVGESSTIIELPASIYQALLIERDAWGSQTAAARAKRSNSNRA